MLDHKFDKKATYLLSGTFGPDSMALLDMLRKEGVTFVVCCVNYHKFDASNDDFNHLKDYCAEKEIPFEGFDTDGLPAASQMKENETFNDWARRVRYSFFKTIYEKYNAAALLIAHQQDDLIETYLTQKRGDGKVAHYGLAPSATVDGMIVLRPLLDFSHEDLIDYNHENRVPFSASNDNFQNQFTRSPIRREIAAMSEIDRERILQEMREENDETERLTEAINKKIDSGEELEIRALIALPYDEFVSTLMRFVSNADTPVHLTASKIQEIRKFCLAPQPNLSMKVAEGVYIIKEYDVLTIGRNFDKLPYTYHLDAPGILKTENFDIDFTMGAEDRGIHAEDYPLTIRTALPSDTYEVHGYLYTVRSLFSNWNMPVRLRYVWPVFANKDGKIIYVPRYRINFREYHTSILTMHLKEEEK